MNIPKRYSLFVWGLFCCISYGQAEWIFTGTLAPGLGRFSTSTVSIYTDPISGTCAEQWVYDHVVVGDGGTMSGVTYTTTADWYVVTTINGVSVNILTSGTITTVESFYTFPSSIPKVVVSMLETECGLVSTSSSSPEPLPSGMSATTSTISVNGNCAVEQVEEMHYSYTISSTTFPTFSISTTFSYSAQPTLGGLFPWTNVYYSLSTISYTTIVENTIPTTITSVYDQTICESPPASSSEEFSPSSVVSSTWVSTSPTGSSRLSIPLTSTPVTASTDVLSYSYSYVYVTTYINDCGIYSSMNSLL